VSQTPPPDDSEAANAARELASLQEQIEAARAVLVRLLQEVVEVESPYYRSQTPDLIEANEQLVIAALRAQTAAAAAAEKLQEISRSAEHDVLTQLPNRVLLLDRFAHAITRARRRGGRLALMFVDLDNFKEINDTLGHHVGDEVLKLVASRLTSSIRADDTISRHGGDEFLILITEVSQPLDAARIADKVIAALGAAIRVGDHALHLSASIGISIYPDDGEDAATLISRADAAMYKVKRIRAGTFAFYGAPPDGEGLPESQPLAQPQQSFSAYKLALAAHERRHAQHGENELLVGLAERPGAAGSRRAGAAASDGVHGRGGA